MGCSPGGLNESDTSEGVAHTRLGAQLQPEAPGSHLGTSGCPACEQNKAETSHSRQN